MKIAMWSGPRNLSTALMYAFGNRADFDAWDEPFYAAYLEKTGLDHPMRSEILAAHDTDPNAIAAKIKAASGNLYMKHMTVHMVNSMPLDWAMDCVNIHLIRHPARVVASYAVKREKPTLADLGFKQHVDIFRQFPGPVIDSADLRRDPKAVLTQLCDNIGLSFDPAMLSWPAGPKPFDGVWAKHWYNAVHKSSQFAGVEGPLPELTGEAADLAQGALPFFEVLRDKAT